MTSKKTTTKLAIIIPQYKETLADISPLLHSISAQCGVDMSAVDVIIVNDGNEAYALNLPDVRTAFPTLNVRLLQTPTNGGVGMARQYGIDNSNSEYIMFCDADDVLGNATTLAIMLNNAPYEVLITDWLEEIENKNGIVFYVPHMRDGTWMHGKCYSRAFLMANNIRFHFDLRVQEDGYFNSLCFGYCKAKYIASAPTYIWRWHSNSTTRRDDCDYFYSSITEYIRAQDLLCTELLQRKNPFVYKKLSTLTTGLYCGLYSIDWQKPTKRVQAHRNGYNTVLRAFIAKYAYMLSQIPAELLQGDFAEQVSAKNYPGQAPTYAEYKAYCSEVMQCEPNMNEQSSTD